MCYSLHVAVNVCINCSFVHLLIVTLVLSCTVSEIWRLISWNCEFFLPHSHLTPSLGMTPIEFLDDLFNQKTRVLVLSVVEDFVILACVVFTQCLRVSDGQATPIVANTGLCIACYKKLVNYRLTRIFPFCLLGLSAAFDSIDHAILLDRLLQWFRVLEFMFKSYLRDRQFCVKCFTSPFWS